jgi:hypothetical protein
MPVEQELSAFQAVVFALSIETCCSFHQIAIRRLDFNSYAIGPLLLQGAFRKPEKTFLPFG